MHLRADFRQFEVVRPGDELWRPSPTAGVERYMLDRIGEEVARATTIVRYAPDSSFPAHTHGGGEEFFVLEGLFLDADGSYGPGSYVRNPIGSSHAPSAGPEGATLFVKLHQFAADDTQRVVIDTARAPWQPGLAHFQQKACPGLDPGCSRGFVPENAPIQSSRASDPTKSGSDFACDALVDGLSVLPLHSFDTEHVALVRWGPHTRFTPHRHWGGEEILVLEGLFEDERGSYPAGTWLRSPHLSAHTPFTGPQGALIYVKTGHLPAA